MEYYLVPFRGKGGPPASGTAFRADGSDQPGATMIDLRPDGSVVDGIAIAALPIREDRPGRIYLGNDLDGPSVAVRTGVASKLGLTLTHSSLRLIILELLTTHAGGSGKWLPLQPVKDGLGGERIQIVLGREKIVDVPVIKGGVDQSENWGCADAASLTCEVTWLEYTGGTSFSLIGNRARYVSVTDEANARAEVDARSVDFIVEVTIAAHALNNFGNAQYPYYVSGAVIGRKSSGVTQTYYLLDTYVQGGGGPPAGAGEYRQIDLYKCINGGFSFINSIVDPATVPNWDDGDLIRLIMNGSLIRIDNVTKSITTGDQFDAAIDGITVGGKRGGLRGNSAVNSNSMDYDGWRIYDIVPDAAFQRTPAESVAVAMAVSGAGLSLMVSDGLKKGS